MVRKLHAPREGEVGMVWGHGRIVDPGLMISHIPANTSPAHSNGRGIPLRIEQRLHSYLVRKYITTVSNHGD